MLGFDPMTQAEARCGRWWATSFSIPRCHDRLRVAEALDLFSTPRARDGGELLDQFGLIERRRSAFCSLSGGERQRLFLVLALLNRPRLVILDELTQGLDPAARRNVWAAVDQLRADGTSVLLVTHELDEAEALCGRVVVLRARSRHRRGGVNRRTLVERHASTAVIRFEYGGSARAAAGPGPAGWTACRRCRRPEARSWCAATGASSRTSAPSWCAGNQCPPT